MRTPRDSSAPDALYALRFDSQREALLFVAQLVDAFATLWIGKSDLPIGQVEVLLERSVSKHAGEPLRVYLSACALHLAATFGLPPLLDGQLERAELPSDAAVVLHLGAEILLADAERTTM